MLQHIGRLSFRKTGFIAIAVIVAGVPLAMTPARAISQKVSYEPDTRAPVVVPNISAAPFARGAAAAAREALSSTRSLYHVDVHNLRPTGRVSFGDLTTVRFQQTYGGLPVFGAQYLVHLSRDERGYRAISTTGRYYTDLSVSTQPGISAAAARRLASLSQRPMVVRRAVNKGLVVIPRDRGVLAYRISVNGSRFGHVAKRDVYVGASAGAIVLAYDTLEAASPVVGSGTAAHGETVPLNLVATGRGFAMRDETKSSFDPSTKRGQIDTYDLHGSGLYVPTAQNLVTSSTPNMPASATQSGAVDAHFNAGIVYDYYQRLTDLVRSSWGSVPAWDSLDGNGTSIKLLVNASDRGRKPLFNAFWDGHEMVFGNPDPVHLYPLSAALDVVGHELTHGITQHTAGLIYVTESGAMNEAYSDYFGNAIQDDYTGIDLSEPSASYFGETLCKQTPPPPSEWSCPLRDVADGRTTADYGRLLEDVDLGGVHVNSTIYSGALWDIRRTLYAGDGQAGADRADAYAYTTLTQFELPTDLFFDGRARMLQAQQTLNSQDPSAFPASDRQVILDAFSRAGITATWETDPTLDSTPLVQSIVPGQVQLASPKVSGRHFVAAVARDTSRPAFVVFGHSNGVGSLSRLRKQGIGLDDETPDISGRKIVYAEGFATLRGVDYDILEHRIGGRTKTIAGGPDIQWFPSIDGRLVAWEDIRHSSDIYARRLRHPTFLVAGGPGDQTDPQVSGNWIAWWNLPDQKLTHSSIGLLNTKTGKRYSIEPTDQETAIGPPFLGPGYVAWFQAGNFVSTEPARGSIMMAKLGSNKETTIVPSGDPHAPVWSIFTGPPTVSGDATYLVYEDQSGIGIDQPTGPLGRRLYFVPVAGGTTQLVTNDIGDQAYASMGTHHTVVWVDGTHVSADIVARRLP
ncbi:MAG: M4 family metallopeptidase [Actinomycetota bacterium]